MSLNQHSTNCHSLNRRVTVSTNENEWYLSSPPNLLLFGCINGCCNRRRRRGRRHECFRLLSLTGCRWHFRQFFQLDQDAPERPRSHLLHLHKETLTPSIPVVLLLDFPQNGSYEQQCQETPWRRNSLEDLPDKTPHKKKPYVENVMKNWSKSNFGCWENDMTTHIGVFMS